MNNCKSLVCCFCDSYLFEEDDAAIEYKNVYILEVGRGWESIFWYDKENRVRCTMCDAVIGNYFKNVRDHVIVWCVRIENEEADEFENIHAVQFLERFIEVCTKCV